MTAGNTPVRARRRAVHHHAQERLAQRRDDLRAVQHHPGQCRRDRELRLPARHAERPDRRQRHRLSADHVRLHLHDHHRQPQLHRHHRAQCHYGDHRQHRLPDQQHHRRRRRRDLSDPRYRTFVDGAHAPSTSASTARSRSAAIHPLGAAPYTRATFTDGVRPTRSTTSPPSTAPTTTCMHRHARRSSRRRR